MVRQQTTETLRDIVVMQTEVEFVELYEGQPLMADVDSFLRSQGFCFLSFVFPMGRPYKPLQFAGNPNVPIRQLLWADAIYVRDFRKRTQWSERQLKAAILLLHELYDAFDLAALLLSELDSRQNTQWQESYVASVLLSHPNLTIATAATS